VKSHRETYPEQYAHPRVGERVVVRRQDGTVAVRGVIERVVSSRFGPLALLEGQSPREAWALSACKVERE
jgi:hypothetical protein